MVVSERNHADTFVDAVSCSCSYVESLVFQSQKDQLVILLFVEELVELGVSIMRACINTNA